jgi:PIN domain nuclease of toxin-antitoxin system
LHLRFLLDTHIVIRWLIDDRKLSRGQFRALQAAMRRLEPVGLSAVSLVEMAILNGQGKLRLHGSLIEFFADMQAKPAFTVLPVTYEIAAEAGSLHGLRDPADRAIVATARVHRLSLVTSDQRIIESGLVPVVA